MYSEPSQTSEMEFSDFKWVEAISEFDETFTKSYNEETDDDISLKLIYNSQKNYVAVTMISHFCLKKLKLKKSKRFLLIYMIKLNMLIT